jgi:hypothetical protein
MSLFPLRGERVGGYRLGDIRSFFSIAGAVSCNATPGSRRGLQIWRSYGAKKLRALLAPVLFLILTMLPKRLLALTLFAALAVMPPCVLRAQWVQGKLRVINKRSSNTTD